MKILRIEQVMNKTSLSKTTIWRLEKKGVFPKRRLIGIKAVGWVEGDIDAWIANQFKKDEQCA